MHGATRNILISGASSGIGAAIARAFKATGARVTATGVTQMEVDAARARPDMDGISITLLDVREAQAMNALIEAVGDLDVLVNCAGVIRRGAEHDPDVFADVLNINLTGTMRLCTAARPGLAARKGCIVNTASMLSFFFWRRPGARLQRQQGWRGAAHQIAGHCLRGGRHSGERGGTGLDRHAFDAGPHTRR